MVDNGVSVVYIIFLFCHILATVFGVNFHPEYPCSKRTDLPKTYCHFQVFGYHDRRSAINIHENSEFETNERKHKFSLKLRDKKDNSEANELIGNKTLKLFFDSKERKRAVGFPTDFNALKQIAVSKDPPSNHHKDLMKKVRSLPPEQANIPLLSGTEDNPSLPDHILSNPSLPLPHPPKTNNTDLPSNTEKDPPLPSLPDHILSDPTKTNNAHPPSNTEENTPLPDPHNTKKADPPSETKEASPSPPHNTNKLSIPSAYKDFAKHYPHSESDGNKVKIPSVLDRPVFRIEVFPENQVHGLYYLFKVQQVARAYTCMSHAKTDTCTLMFSRSEESDTRFTLMHVSEEHGTGTLCSNFFVCNVPTQPQHDRGGICIKCQRWERSDMAHCSEETPCTSIIEGSSDHEVTRILWVHYTHTLSNDDCPSVYMKVDKTLTYRGSLPNELKCPDAVSDSGSNKATQEAEKEKNKDENDKSDEDNGGDDKAKEKDKEVLFQVDDNDFTLELVIALLFLLVMMSCVGVLICFSLRKKPILQKGEAEELKSESPEGSNISSSVDAASLSTMDVHSAKVMWKRAFLEELEGPEDDTSPRLARYVRMLVDDMRQGASHQSSDARREVFVEKTMSSTAVDAVQPSMSMVYEYEEEDSNSG